MNIYFYALLDPCRPSDPKSYLFSPTRTHGPDRPGPLCPTSVRFGFPSVPSPHMSLTNGHKEGIHFIGLLYMLNGLALLISRRN